MNQKDLNAIIGKKGRPQWISSQRSLLERISQEKQNLAPHIVKGMKLRLNITNSEIKNTYSGKLHEITAETFLISITDTKLQLEGLKAEFVLGNNLEIFFDILGSLGSFISYQFKTHLIAAIFEEELIIEVIKPKEFSLYKPRTKAQTDIELQGMLIYQNEGKSYSTSFLTKNISTGGVGIILQDDINALVNDFVQLIIEAPAQEALKVQGKIVRKNEVSLPNSVKIYSLGINFTEINNELQKHIYRFVFYALRRNSESINSKTKLGWIGYRPMVVSKIIDESEDVRSFYLECSDSNLLPNFKSGQFLTVKVMIKNKENKLLPEVRCYSLSDSFNPNYYRISVKKVSSSNPVSGTVNGVVSGFLHDKIKLHDIIYVGAPKGDFTLELETNSPLVFIAGGVGLTPFLSMLNTLVDKDPEREVWLFLGVRNKAQHLFKKHLETLTTLLKNFKLYIRYDIVTAEDRLGIDYHFQELISVNLFKNLSLQKDYQYYLCGPVPMMFNVIKDLLEWDVHYDNIHYEAFGPNPIAKLISAAKGEVSHRVWGQVHFKTANITLQWSPNCDSILQLAEASGIKIPSGCRVGNCHTCIVSVLEGKVVYERPPSSDPGSKFCLTCIAKPDGDIIIDI